MAVYAHIEYDNNYDFYSSLNTSVLHKCQSENLVGVAYGEGRNPTSMTHSYSR